MIHPEEQTEERPASRGSGLLMAVLLFLAIAAVAAFGYMKSRGIDPADLNIKDLFPKSDEVRQLNEATNIIEIPYDAGEHPVFGTYMEYITRCSRDGIQLLDKKGRELWSAGIPLNNPLIRTNGKEMLVADIGGRDIYVISGKSVSWKDKTDESIQNAEINEDGYVTVITDKKLYNGEIKVYDSHGIVLRQSVIANNFAVTAKVSPSGEWMALDLVNASGVKAFTCLEFFDMEGTEPLIKEMPQDNGLYPFIWFCGKDRIFAAGSSSIALLGKDGTTVWDKRFSGMDSAAVISGKRLAAAVREGNSVLLKVFNTDGTEFSSTGLNARVTNITAHDGVIAVNTGRKAIFLTERCKTIGEYSSVSEITGIQFFNRQQAMIITKSHITIVDI